MRCQTKVKNISEELVAEIKKDIEGADKVLVGIGLEWLADIKAEGLYSEENSYSAEWLMANGDVVIEDNEKEERIRLYKKLKEVLTDKDSYIISLCYDDLIYQAFTEEDKVVTPCGGYRYLQCGQHIMSRDEVIFRDGEAACPLCGMELSYNNILNEQYMEESYIPKFQDYKGWLQSTINKKLVILELGTDMRFPGVIRFAFDRLVKFNMKSKMYRVNKNLCMLDSSSDGRGEAVEGDSMNLINIF